MSLTVSRRLRGRGLRRSSSWCFSSGRLPTHITFPSSPGPAIGPASRHLGAPHLHGPGPTSTVTPPTSRGFAGSASPVGHRHLGI